ncbi:SDR family oxidoreductase [Mangrovibrevibacter kandeliae]|uniref:SDR family oxidoreductase n=1 Tax=Mangrovibrevibacter kandeliae TaxID=2968473 RepID=UPI0021183A48|nr:SDR family oxidoreductase [Aurantimonas sp. CSK15Z-1]MCQ8782838.1 SDR family oxidoreductase [Aurantimonas sp. CSK15Z-1]
MNDSTLDIVTGGAGFIGSHLVDRLIAAGRRVRVIDNFSNGAERNLVQHQGNAQLEVVKADIGDKAAVQGLFEGAERVFHLAALADIVPSINEPEAYFRANVDGTFNVLEGAKAAGVKRFLYAASSSCYGIADAVPTPETASISPQYPYALTKYLGEELVMHWAKVYQLPAVSLRLFNVFGPRARTSGTYGAVFGVFLAQIKAGKPVTIVGDGTQTRDFTFVADVVSAFIRAAESDRAGQIYNVGSGGTYSVNRLVELLGAKETVHIPKRPGEPDVTFADTGKISRELDWHAEISFEEGCRVMLEHIAYWENAPVWTVDKIAEATRDWFKYLGKE